MKLKEFEKHLTENGCTLLREGGNHSIWVNKANLKQSAVKGIKKLITGCVKTYANNLIFLRNKD